MKKVKPVAAKSLSVEHEINIFSGVLRAFENFIHQPLLTQEEQDARAKTGAFPYIPLQLAPFLEQLFKARSILNPDWVSQRYSTYPRPSFIDVGCGIGTKVLIAKQFCLDYYGIEINKKYVEVARKLLGDYKKTILQGDARKHDYSPYDIIYFYCPMRVMYKKDKKGNYSSEPDNRNEVALEQHIITTAKVGAIILANVQQHEAFRAHPEKWGLKQIENSVFQKVEEVK